MDKPQVKKIEVSREISRPSDGNFQPRIRNVQDKEKLQILVQQWRTERQARLMSRLMKKTGHGGYSSALFGTVPTSNQENHALIPKKIKEKPPPEVVNIEERKSVMHAFAARPATVTQRQLPSRTGSSSRLQPDQPGTSSASKEIKEIVPKKAPKIGSSKPNSAVVKGKPKPLVIRDTLASRLRMEKANPMIGLNIPSASHKAANAESTLNLNKDKPGPSNEQRSRSTSVPAVLTVSLSRPKTPSKVTANNNQKIMTASHILHKRSTLAGSSQKKETVSLEKPEASHKKTVYDGVASKVSSRCSSRSRTISSTYFDRLDTSDARKYVIRSQSAPNIKDTDAHCSSVKFQGSKPNSVEKINLKPPVIRHTLASRLHMEEANPMIELNIPSLSLNAANSESTSDPNKGKPGPSNEHCSRSTSVPAGHKVSLSHPEIPSKVITSNPRKTLVASHIVPRKSTLAGSSQKTETTSLEKPYARHKKTVYDGVTAKVSSRRSSIRRSVSSTYFDRLDTGDAQKYVIRSQSAPDIKDANKRHSSVKFQGVPSPIREEEPSPREAPMTVLHSKKNMTPVASTSGNCNTPKPEVLRKRLVDWLSKRGKSLGNYHHLNSFGIHAKSINQPRFSLSRPRTPMPSTVLSTARENPASPVNLNETVTLESESESSGETKMETEAVSPIQRSPLAAISLNETVTTSPPHCSPVLDVVKPAENEEKENTDTKELFIPETLADLYKLIQLGYPRDQCDEWLTLIRRANKDVTNMPQYWECLAALQEAHGDFSAAIDCYGRAAFHGAETAKIKASLEVLRDKFSALNVPTNNPKRTPSKRKTLDPKQVFTSSAIKFALQQRAVKRLSSDLGGEAVSLNYVVTPVRRSTRKSTCQYKSTPTSQLFSKLEDIAPGVLQEMMFQKNVALEPRE